MLPVTSRHAPGTIVLGTGRQPRFNEFWVSMTSLQVPSGTRLEWNRGYDVAWNRNQGVRAMVGEWVWFMDDDHTFEPDTLLRLLDHGVQAVGPVAARCTVPYAPIACIGATPLSWDALHGKGLLALPAGSVIGMGGFLVRKRALERVGDPWFKVGTVQPDRQSEDTWFCSRLQATGVAIHLDRDLAIGHTMSHTVLPVRTDEGWEIRLV